MSTIALLFILFPIINADPTIIDGIWQDDYIHNDQNMSDYDSGWVVFNSKSLFPLPEYHVKDGDIGIYNFTNSPISLSTGIAPNLYHGPYEPFIKGETYSETRSVETNTESIKVVLLTRFIDSPNWHRYLRPGNVRMSSITVECDATAAPSVDPTFEPTSIPTSNPSSDPTTVPTRSPTFNPSTDPTAAPSVNPTDYPSSNPSETPTTDPTIEPSVSPTISPTNAPTLAHCQRHIIHQPCCGNYGTYLNNTCWDTRTEQPYTSLLDPCSENAFIGDVTKISSTLMQTDNDICICEYNVIDCDLDPNDENVGICTDKDCENGNVCFEDRITSCCGYYKI